LTLPRTLPRFRGEMISELNERSREILRLIVKGYVESGEPVGSRTLSRKLNMKLSPATVRNTMADLEDLGLLYAPHTSAGRLPTEAGLRLFVDGLLEIGNITEDERKSIEAKCKALGRSYNQVLEEASSLLSGLSHCAGLVMSPKTEGRLRHVEFVSLGPGRALVVLVTEDGLVENRVIDVAMGLPSSVLVEATNYLSSKLVGRTLTEAQAEIRREVAAQRSEIDELTKKVVQEGLAVWSDTPEDAGAEAGVLIVRGQANLLDDVSALADLEHIRALFNALETKEALLSLLDATDGAQGVQIFIGSDNELFSLAGCSMIISPFTSGRDNIVGAIGVVGPTRINYARIIPMVDYTAKVVSRLIG